MKLHVFIFQITQNKSIRNQFLFTHLKYKNESRPIQNSLFEAPNLSIFYLVMNSIIEVDLQYLL